MKKSYSEVLTNNMDNNVYDCLVIGSGTSSEPVIFHLSKTNLNSLIIDRSNIYKEYVEIDNTKKFISNITPKQIFSNLKIHDQKSYISLSSNASLKCNNFSYVYSYVSGGLSNFWGGGLFNWPDSEIIKATTVPIKSIRESYENISKRLKILSRDDFLKKSSFSNHFLKKNEKISPVIFQSSRFFISENSLLNHDFNKQKYDQHLIWKASHTIREYIDNSNNLKYFSGTTALSIKKYENYYEISCLQGNEYKRIKSKSIFLCSGVINSTYLAFSALDLDEELFKLNHSFAAITPIIYFGFLSRFHIKNTYLPDLSWSLISKGVNISGYLLSSFFIHMKIVKRFKNGFLKIIYSLLENILSSIAFITIFTSSTQTNTELKIKKISNQNNDIDEFLLELRNKDSAISSKEYMSKELKKLSTFIKGKFYLMKFLTQHAKTGGDIHYGSTMPEKKIMKSPINTSFTGEIEKAKNIYACDASRLGFISSLPHTLTVMAIIDSSMPLIIEKLKKGK
tara:strand:+ start:1739 stop:3268 length:1530 start_codon:yes stop_codon:yes gene_type:complete